MKKPTAPRLDHLRTMAPRTSQDTIAYLAGDTRALRYLLGRCRTLGVLKFDSITQRWAGSSIDQSPTSAVLRTLRDHLDEAAEQAARAQAQGNALDAEAWRNRHSALRSALEAITARTGEAMAVDDDADHDDTAEGGDDAL